MNRLNTAQLTLVFALVLAAGRCSVAQSIVGDTIDIWTVAQSSGTEFFQETVLVVDPGIEYTATILVTDIYDVNIGPTSIVLNTLDEWFSPWFNSGHPPSRLEFRDIDVPGMPGLSTGGVSVLFSDTIVPEDGAPMGYPAFSASNVTFTADSVEIETGPYTFPVGSRIQIDLTFVPEPGTASLLGSALLAAAMAMRRRFQA